MCVLPCNDDTIKALFNWTGARLPALRVRLLWTDSRLVRSIIPFLCEKRPHMVSAQCQNSHSCGIGRFVAVVVVVVQPPPPRPLSVSFLPSNSGVVYDV